MAKAPVKAVPPAAEPRRPLTMSERLERKTQSMGHLSQDAADNAEYTVSINGRVPVELVGYLLAMNERYVVFRYKKEKSSKTIISRFLMSDVVKIVGEVGEASMIQVLKNTPFAHFTGKVAVQKNGLVKVTHSNGDSILFNPNLKLESFAFSINAEFSREKEEEHEQETKPAAKGKVTNIRSKKEEAKPAAKTGRGKRAAVEAFDEEDDEAFAEDAASFA